MQQVSSEKHPRAQRSTRTVVGAEARRDQEQRHLDDQQCLDRLKANAAHCRKLAEAASDPEARQALLEIASDIEAALPIVDRDAPRNVAE